MYIHSGFCNSTEVCMLSQLYYGQVFVQMAQSASEGEVTLSDLEGWRCVSTALGGPSVMTFGTTETQVWCADSWDTPHTVYVSIVLH